jgi:hypothetical protein
MDMRRVFVFLLAIFMTIGISTAASASPVDPPPSLLFTLDFRGGDQNFPQWPDGPCDTCTTINLVEGNSVYVDILVSTINFEAGDGLKTFGFSLSFLPFRLDGKLVEFGADWDPTYSSIPAGVSIPGLIAVSGESSGPVAGENILLASFEFTCTGVGHAADEIVVLDNPATQDFTYWLGPGDWPYTKPNLDEFLSGEEGCGLSGSIKNVPVPVPATLFLLGSGILGLVGVRRKIKK